MKVKVCYFERFDVEAGQTIKSDCMARVQDLRSGKIRGIPLYHTTIDIDESKLNADGL